MRAIVPRRSGRLKGDELDLSVHGTFGRRRPDVRSSGEQSALLLRKSIG
jgi:hypothetical protein